MELDDILEMSMLLPKYSDIEHYVKLEPETSYIFRFIIQNISNIQQSNGKHKVSKDTEEAEYLVHSLVDKYWERINIGHFSQVSQDIRKIYAVGNHFKIFYLLFRSSEAEQLAKCNEILDQAILLGCTQNLYVNNVRLQNALQKYFSAALYADLKLPIIKPLQRQLLRCDIPQYDCPSIDFFRKNCFETKCPALLLKSISHWSALEKWRDLNYIIKIAGNRTVPVEIGSNYTSEEWSQQLIKIRDFLQRQFSGNIKDSEFEIEYLAQHELFDQVPELMEDIRIPDYCILTTTAEQKVDIKAWLGPKGTISPLHYDPKHNLLCQVFGTKTVILAAPEDSSNLYPHNIQFLNNTSQIDASNLDMQKYPKSANVKFLQLTIQEGDCLYIPKKWWHYVRADTESFSVSFWWE